MSGYERPDRPALTELEPMLHALGEELAAWRRRALRAEAELQEAKRTAAPQAGGELPVAAPERGTELERREAELQRRLAQAREHVERLRTRLRFLEERTQGAA